MQKTSSDLLNKTDLFVYYSVMQLSIEVMLWQETLSGASGWHYILIWRREAAARQKQQKYNQGEEESQESSHCISATSYISWDSRLLNGSVALNSITWLYWKILEQLSETKSSPRGEFQFLFLGNKRKISVRKLQCTLPKMTLSCLLWDRSWASETLNPTLKAVSVRKQWLTALCLQIHTKILPRDAQGRHLLGERLVTDERGICNYGKIPDARKEKFLIWSQRQGWFSTRTWFGGRQYKGSTHHTWMMEWQHQNSSSASALDLNIIAKI